MKTLLLKLASQIIHKYGEFYISPESVVRIYDKRFQIVSYSLINDSCQGYSINIDGKEITL